MSDLVAPPSDAAPRQARADEPRLRVHVVLGLVQLAFAGFHVVAKAVLSTVDPLALAGIRVLVSLPLLAALAWRHDRRLPPLRDLPMLALLGLLGVFANQLLFILGLRHTTATNASILMPSIPVLAVAVGAALGIERIGARRLTGILLAVAGALTLLDPGRLRWDELTLGNVLILLNCLSYAAFLVLHRPVLARLPWRTVIAGAFFFGGGAVLSVTAPQLAALHPGRLGATTWLGIAYVALVTVVAYPLVTWAVERSSPTLTATYITLQPLFTAVLAALFLGERLGLPQAAGFLLIAAGLLRVSFRRRC